MSNLLQVVTIHTSIHIVLVLFSFSRFCLVLIESSSRCGCVRDFLKNSMNASKPYTV